MRLSISAIKLFKACRRAYQLRYVYNIVPAERSEALGVGSTYHAYVEEITKDGTVPEIVDKETAMANAYYKYIYPQMPKFEPEVWFEQNLGYNKVLVGRLDGKADGAIIEHKTTSASLDEYEFDLQYNEQLLAYMLASEVNTAYYTLCKKPTLRQKQSETTEEFGQRCFEWYAEDTQQKIRMLKICIPQEEIDEFSRRLKKDFYNIHNATKKDDFYRNTCHCNAWGGKCEYAPICHNYDPQQQYIGFERREPYEDSKGSGQHF